MNNTLLCLCRNIKLTISYDGTNYKGWQIQKNGPTIQAELEKAILEVFGKPHRVYASSRTDAGAHAKGQSVHFKTSVNIPLKKIRLALNAILPQDISVIRVENKPLDFHAQFDAKGKLYRYYVLNSRHRDPFKERYAWRVPYKLNISLMRREALLLKGRHNFKSFQAADKKERSSVRKIFFIRVQKWNSFIVFEIEANGFLYNMVRNIVGTLVEIGRGYFPPGSMKEILRQKDRTKAGPTVPAKGLFLIKVKY